MHLEGADDDGLGTVVPGIRDVGDATKKADRNERGEKKFIGLVESHKSSTSK